MLGPMLLLSGLVSCGPVLTSAPCDTTHVDVGIWRVRGGAAYALVPHRGGYLLVVRVVGNSATVLYPRSPTNQVSTWDNDTLRLVDTSDALKSANVTLIIHWSTEPFLLPGYSAGDTWDNARLTATWSGIQTGTPRALRVRVLDAGLAGSEHAVVVATRMDREAGGQQIMGRVMASWPHEATLSSGYELSHPLALPTNLITPCGIISSQAGPGPAC